MEIFAEGVSAGSRLGGGHGVLAGDAAEEEEEEEGCSICGAGGAGGSCLPALLSAAAVTESMLVDSCAAISSGAAAAPSASKFPGGASDTCPGSDCLPLRKIFRKRALQSGHWLVTSDHR
jgi:hypothetical protein